MDLKQALAKKLTKKELYLLKTSFDVVGSIAIIDIPKELEKKEKIIAEELLNLIKHVKTVLKKTGIRYGKYRRQKLKFLIGERKKTTIHKESNSRLKLNVETCYFSARLSHDRLMIMKQIKPEEKILVMFSGIAPYPIVIARNTNVKKIIGVEFNPEAHKYALENLKLNKVENKIELYCGDVKKIVPKLGKFDRILMPAPKNAELFLDVAKKAAKKNTIIHFYCFATEEEIKKVKELIKKTFNCKILNCVKTNQHKPRSYRYRIDFKIL